MRTYHETFEPLVLLHCVIHVCHSNESTTLSTTSSSLRLSLATCRVREPSVFNVHSLKSITVASTSGVVALLVSGRPALRCWFKSTSSLNKFHNVRALAVARLHMQSTCLQLGAGIHESKGTQGWWCGVTSWAGRFRGGQEILRP